MLLKLTHPELNYELYVESEEIVVMERYNRPESVLIRPDEKPIQTALVLKSGRIIACKETPGQIHAMLTN
jgi:hypothetical protein